MTTEVKDVIVLLRARRVPGKWSDTVTRDPLLQDAADLLEAAESRATAAEGRVALLEEERDEARKRAALLEAALTPSVETKAAFMGEFYMGVTLMARGQEDRRSVQIPWTSIKEIMAAIKTYADEASP